MKPYESPEMQNLGSVFVMTRSVIKTFGAGDGVIFDPDGQDGPLPGIPIGGSAI